MYPDTMAWMTNVRLEQVRAIEAASTLPLSASAVPAPDMP
ncbi:hypothetical protein Y717_15675 [Streptomyces scopuliridis RB72]|uniref:Uncharacterized protein n=1 Tax=Streptomyces scopuliridis RB72 TaxID=1440053 RepID=A0A2T7T9C1_9ACTN|nr:hypothetical protein Y717_15675 [Streptomyces scopuliridis RB72]